MTDDEFIFYIDTSSGVSFHVDAGTMARDADGAVLRGPEGPRTLEAALNIAHGFADGECNEYDAEGRRVEKPAAPGAHAALEDASFRLSRTRTLRVRWGVRRDGTASVVRILGPSSGSCSYRNRADES